MRKDIADSAVDEPKNRDRRFTDTKAIVFSDHYRVRHLASSPMDLVVDVGANRGTFSLMSRMMWPRARIVAFEPWKEAAELAALNVGGLRVELYRAALGRSSSVRMIGEAEGTSTAFSDSGDGETAPAGLLSDLLSAVNANPERCLSILKCDVEGAETTILELEPEILRSFSQFSMEVHFKSSHNPRHDRLPEWQWYDSVLKKVMEGRVSIYHKSSKAKGVGHYISCTKELCPGGEDELRRWFLEEGSSR